MPSAGSGRYISLKICSGACEAQHIGLDGLPQECERTPVWELLHSSGRRFRLCDYHIECYWGFWSSFRDAVRDIWPVKISQKF
jgi:hypothetical protein